MWRTVGFLMSFSVVLQGMTLVAYVAMLAGGRQKRETGWKVLACFLLLTGLVQCASMAIIVSVTYLRIHWVSCSCCCCRWQQIC